MATLSYTPVSWNGTAINSGNYSSKFEDARPGPHNRHMMVDPIEATRTGFAPQAVRTQPKSETWELTIKLANTDETDVRAMTALFIEGQQVYLRVTDGSAVTWRISCHALSAPQRVPGSKQLFVVAIRVAYPLWEADTLITDSELNKQTSPVTMGTAVAGNKTPAGDRSCLPTFTITADAAKGIASILDDATYSLRGWFVNRSPKPLTNVPIWLFDASGAASRIATNSSAAGATVLQTTGATTAAANIAAGAATITLTSAASWPAKGMGFITDTRGVGFHDQFYYTSIAGAVLQGVVWLRAASNGSDPGLALQTAGGIAHTTVQVSAIQPSGIQISADDLRVALDDDPNVKRSTVAWNTAASDVVIHVSVPEAIVLTLASAMTASLPAVGSVLYFVEGVSQLPPAAFLAIGDEIVHYSSKSGNGVVLDGARGLWGTTAAAHAVTVPVYANPHRFTVSVGWSRADVAPEYTLAERAACQLTGSNNQTLKYGDEADDPSTVFFDRNRPQRAMSFRPGFDLDGNTVSPIMSIVVDANKIAAGNVLTFNDDVPGDGSPPYNYAELTVPQGVRKLTTSLQHDWTPAAEILNLELWTRDVGGILKLQDQLQQAAAAAARQSTPSTTIYGVKLKGRYNIITGFEGQDGTNALVISNASASSIADGVIAVKFTFTGDRRPKKVQARLQKTTAGSQAVTCYVVDASGANGTPGQLIGSLGNGTPTPNNTAATIEWTMPPYGMTAGVSYWLIFWTPSTFASVNFKGYVGTNFSDRMPVYQRVGGAWVFQTSIGLWVSITGGYDNSGNALIEANNPVTFDTGARTNTHASFDKAVYLLETLQSVYVHRVTGFVSGATAGSMLHINGIIANATPSPAYSILIDKWMKIGATLAINCNDSTVIYTEDSIAYPLQKCITPGDLTTWLALSAAVANAVTLTDPSLLAPAQLDLVTTYRGLKV